MADSLTPDDQWTQINYARSFLIATLDKVKACWDDLAALQATATEIDTNINQVPIKYSFPAANYVQIRIGELTNGDPLVDMTIPMSWISNP